MNITAPPPCLAPKTRAYAIGDIHGCTPLLAKLIQQIEADLAQSPCEQAYLIFLGDYVDRGMDSKGVINFLLSNLPIGFKTVFIRGNHDQVLMDFVQGDLDSAVAWLPHGGMASLASYGLNPFIIRATEDFDVLQSKFAQIFPAEHLAFLNQTVSFFELGDYYFVHAGIRPHVPLANQKDEDRLWIRHEFIPHKQRHEKMIVHGHTIVEDGTVFENRIAVDTGAYASGCLSCLVLEGASQRWIHT